MTWLPDFASLAGLVGRGGLLLFSFSVLGGAGGANAGLALMLIGFLWCLPKDWSWLRQDPWFLLTIVFLCYLAARMLAAADLPQLTFPVRLDASFDLLRVGFVPVLLVAYWYRTRPSWTFLLLGLALMGFIVRISQHTTWEKLSEIADGASRATFGNSANHFGLWCAVCLLGVAVFAPRLRIWCRYRRGCSLLVFGWLALIALFVLGIIYSESRGVWLSVVVLFVCILFLAMFAKERRNRILVVSFLIAAMAGIFLGVPPIQRQIVHRVVQGWPTIETALNKGVESVPPSSLGYRIHMYREALQRFLERPVFGWGPGSQESFIKTSEIPQLNGTRFSHFHNTYVDLLIQLGIVGFSLYAALGYLLVGRLFYAYRDGFVAMDTTFFLTGAFLLMAVVALSDEVIFSRHGKYVSALLGGIIYGVWIYKNRSGTACDVRNG